LFSFSLFCDVYRTVDRHILYYTYAAVIAVSLFASHFMLPGIITRSMTDSALSLGKMWDMSGVEISHRQNYAPDICRQAARWQNIAFGHVSLDCCLNKAMVHRVFGTFYALNSSSLGACCCL